MENSFLFSLSILTSYSYQLCMLYQCYFICPFLCGDFYMYMLLAMAIYLILRLSPETQIVSRLRIMTSIGLIFYWPRGRRLGCNFFSYSGDPLNPLKRETSFSDIPFLSTLINFSSCNSQILFHSSCQGTIVLLLRKN
jgi:hypothetical protein